MLFFADGRPHHHGVVAEVKAWWVDSTELFHQAWDPTKGIIRANGAFNTTISAPPADLIRQVSFLFGLLRPYSLLMKSR